GGGRTASGWLGFTFWLDEPLFTRALSTRKKRHRGSNDQEDQAHRHKAEQGKPGTKKESGRWRKARHTSGRRTAGLMRRKLVIDRHRVPAKNYGRHNCRADDCDFDAHHHLTRIRLQPVIYFCLHRGNCPLKSCRMASPFTIL